MKKATINDVAKAAKVSVATVDRVLNNRSGVRLQTVEKVLKAILKLNYKPGILPDKLPKSRSYRLLFIVREGRTSFMVRLGEAVDELSERLKDENVYIEKRLVGAFDGTNAADMLDGVQPQDWDGVAMVMVPDLPLVKQAIDGCVERGVKVVTVVSDLPSSARSYFVGIDNIAAGRVAGRLLGRFTLASPGNLAVVMASLSLRDHVERHLGCAQVVQAEFPHLTLLPPLEGRDNPEDTFTIVNTLLSGPNGKNVKAIYSSGAANQGLIEALVKNERQKDIVTISHELTPRSRRALLDGTFDAILSQDAEREASQAVTLLRQLCDSEPLERQNFISTDIYFPDNLP
ncbi:MAG: LacI family DNA-binding transcriptional regulator [Deltaproteobacteria bacterium]|jgi:LacI family transcriptional regulator|nr:LacI family DNA-binding transcriptional regulator [Deltaproteobacteria bacterium]